MRLILRLGCGAVAAAGLVVSLSAGPDVPLGGRWDEPWAPAPALSERERLARKQAALLARIRDKQHVAAQVAAGQLSLLQAAARFHQLNEQSWPEGRRQLPWANPGQSYEEILCRHVIGYVRGLTIHPTVAARADRLEAELQDRLRHGPLVLPEQGGDTSTAKAAAPPSAAAE